MKSWKSLLCLLLALFLLSAPALALPSALRMGDLSTPQTQYELAEQVAVYCQALHVDSGPNDHPLLRCYRELFDTDEALSANRLRRTLIDWFAKDPDNCELFIDTMLSLYDAHSLYLSYEEYARYFPETQSYTGVGIRYSQYGVFLRIEGVYDGSPAQKAGLRVGDCVAAVNGTDIRTRTPEEVAELMDSLTGGSITFGILRAGEAALLSVTLTPDYIDIPNVEYGLLEDGAAFVRLRRFDSEDFFVQLDAAVRFLKKNAVKTLLIDLRDNPGGSITHLLAALNAFIPQAGREMFSVTTREGVEVYRSLGGGVAAERIWVLVNENSASSSEIFAGVLRDLGLAKLAGAQTYGKALGQMLYPFRDGLLILTESKVLLPLTGSYQGEGLRPDVALADRENAPDLDGLAPLDTAAAVGAASPGGSVLALEQRLRLTGYFFGEPDEVFDESTQQALQTLQAALALPRGASATPELLKKLTDMTQRFADAAGLEPASYEEILALLP